MRNGTNVEKLKPTVEQNRIQRNITKQREKKQPHAVIAMHTVSLGQALLKVKLIENYI